MQSVTLNSPVHPFRTILNEFRQLSYLWSRVRLALGLHVTHVQRRFFPSALLLFTLVLFLVFTIHWTTETVGSF